MALGAGLRAIAIGGACALFGLVAGCGSNSEESTSGAAHTSPSEDSPSEETSSSDECAWISTDDVTEAVGEAMEVSAASEEACMFDAVAEDGPALSLWATAIQIDQKEYEEGSKDACDDVNELDVEDAGWTCEALGDPQGSVIKDEYIITIDPTDFPSDDEAYAVLEKLLPKVTFP